MDGQNGMQRHIALSLLIGLSIAVSPVLAQKQEPQQPARSPSNPQTTDTKDGKKDDKDRQRGTVGKSKLEKDTGTINVRIFEVLPNYGTVENAKELPPLTTGQKFRLATAGVFDWGGLSLQRHPLGNRTSKE